MDERWIDRRRATLGIYVWIHPRGDRRACYRPASGGSRARQPLALLDAVQGRRGLLATLEQRLRRFLPVFSVEGNDWQAGEIHAIDAANIHDPHAGVDAWPGERVDSTMPAEVMFRGHRVELVKRQLVLALDDAEVGLGGAMPQGAPAAAHRAVAIDDVLELRLQLEGDAAAVA